METLHTNDTPRYETLDRQLSAVSLDLPSLGNIYTIDELAKTIAQENDIEFSKNPYLSTLQQIYRLAQQTWNEKQKNEGIAAFNDTPVTVATLFTAPGATNVLSYLSAGVQGVRELVGASLVLTEPETFTEGKELPSALLNFVSQRFNIETDKVLENLVRGTRLYVPDIAGSYGPNGEALRITLDPILDLHSDKIVFTRYISGPPSLANSSALRGYKAKGFIQTDVFITEEAIGPDGASTCVEYEYLVYDPASKQARDQLHRFQERIKALDRAERPRFAASFAALPSKNAQVVLCGDTVRHGFLLAEISPLNTFTYIPTRAPDAAQYLRRSNLHTKIDQQGPLRLPGPTEMLGLLDGLAPILDHESISEFLDAILIDTQLKPGATIFIQCTAQERERIKKEFDHPKLRCINENEIFNLESAPTFALQYEHLPQTSFVRAIEQIATLKPVKTAGFSSVAVYERNSKNSAPARIEVAQRIGAQTKDILVTDDESALVRSGLRPILLLADQIISPFTTEQLALQITDLAGEDSTADQLERYFGITAHRAVSLPAYLTSPTELDEVVHPRVMRKPELPKDFDLLKDPTLKRAAGRVSSKSLLEYLQAGISGGHLDERSCRMMRMYLLQIKGSLGPWATPRFQLKNQAVDFIPSDIAATFTPERDRAIFTKRADIEPKYHRTYQLSVAERLANNHLRLSDWETVLPGGNSTIPYKGEQLPISSNKANLLPIFLSDGTLYIGFHKWDSPVVQRHSPQLFGYTSSQHTASVEFHIPKGIKLSGDRSELIEYLRTMMENEFPGLVCNEFHSGGSAWTASSGISNKIFTTGFVEVEATTALEHFHWLPFNEVKRLYTDPSTETVRKYLVCGPTHTATTRLIHLWDDFQELSAA